MSTNETYGQTDGFFFHFLSSRTSKNMYFYRKEGTFVAAITILSTLTYAVCDKKTSEMSENLRYSELISLPYGGE